MIAQTASPPKPNWSLLALLRFILATIVVFCHTTFLITPLGLMPRIGGHLGGFSAVFGFLLISGFSIAHSLERNSKGFYARRFERLAPTYYLCLLFGAGIYALYFLTTSVDNVEWPGMSESPWQWAISLLMLGGILAVPIPLMAPAWSLGAEICYYAVAPWLRRASLKVIMALGGVSLAFYIYTGSTRGNNFPEWFGLTTIGCLFWPWVAGWLFYHYRGHRLCWPALVGIMALFGQASGPLSAGYHIPLALVGMALIAGDQWKLSPRWQRIFNYLGDLSFPLYLCHYPGIYFAKYLIYKGWLPNSTLVIMLLTYGSAAFITGIVQLRSNLSRVRQQKNIPTVPATEGTTEVVKTEGVAA